MRLPREAYIRPDHVRVETDAADVEIYTREVVKNGKAYYCVLAFHGKASKPDFNVAFRDAESRRKHIEAFIRSRADWKSTVASRKREASQPHTLKVGDILSSSWGYEQTNIDFYEVTRIVGAHFVEVRELEQEREQTGFMSGDCRPIPGKFKGPVLRRKSNQTNSISIESFATASPWDGQREHWTAYA